MICAPNGSAAVGGAVFARHDRFERFTARRRSYNQQEDSDQRTGSDSIVSIFFVIFVSSVDIFGDATGSRIMSSF